MPNNITESVDSADEKGMRRPTILQCGRFELSLARPLIMGIVNVTDDSFSGDGVGDNVAQAIARAEAQLEAGADILDLGAESSRPGSTPISVDLEIARLLPVIEALRDCGRPISIDTYKPAVMSAVLAAGVDMINDIYALQKEGALELMAAEPSVAICLMHMQGNPHSMQNAPQYQDIIQEINQFFAERVDACLAQGIARQRLIIDPGFGFGKSLGDNLTMARELSKIATDYPLLIGVSRKSMLGALTGQPVEERDFATVVAGLWTIVQGAQIVRVHNVALTRQALDLWQHFQPSPAKD